MPRGEKGRPSKLTPEVKSRLIEAIRAGSYYETACAYAGVSYATFRDWMRRGEGSSDRASSAEYVNFVKEIKEADAQGELSAIAAIRGASKEDWRASAWMLERRHSDRWASTQKVRVEVEKQVEAELNLLFEAIASDPNIPNDAKLRIIEAAENLQNRAAVATEN